MDQISAKFHTLMFYPSIHRFLVSWTNKCAILIQYLKWDQWIDNIKLILYCLQKLLLVTSDIELRYLQVPGQSETKSMYI